MMKARTGKFVRSRLPIQQKNEVFCKAICHNIFCLIQSLYELGIVPEIFPEIVKDAAAD